MALIQAVPNFSEGRCKETVEEILSVFRLQSDCKTLDQHADGDHNRLVVTVLGDPESLAEACFAATKKASELIDMEEHTGSHPRIGAADVVPLIPIEGVSMRDCVQMAEDLGQRIAEELNIPVYLYEEAAKKPSRQKLENIRRGEYEGLKEEIGSDERAPDFGPLQMHPRAGATVVGARQALIAYNVYLRTDDLSIARQIARDVRASNGGFVNVKAIGLEVQGEGVQVSMNLTDYRKTPIHRVYEFIKREAAHRGVGVEKSEIVGLIPQAALQAVAEYYLNLDDFSRKEQILEARLQE